MNVNPDKSYSIGVVPNPMITINRMDARHIDYEELTIVLGVPTMWSEKYEGSTIHTLKDTLTTHERLRFGYIDIGDAKRLVGEPNSVPDIDKDDDDKINDIYTVLGLNDFPTVDNVAYFENEVFPSSAMQHIQNILGNTLPESVKNVLVIS